RRERARTAPGKASTAPARIAPGLLLAPNAGSLQARGPPQLRHNPACASPESHGTVERSKPARPFMRFPLLIRAALIGAAAVSILLPLALIQGKVHERRARAQGVLAEFARETSGPQVVAGPFLAIACEETYTEERE